MSGTTENASSSTTVQEPKGRILTYRRKHIHLLFISFNSIKNVGAETLSPEAAYKLIERTRWDWEYEVFSRTKVNGDFVISTKVPLYSVNKEYMRNGSNNSTEAISWDLKKANKAAKLLTKADRSDFFYEDCGDSLYAPELRDGMFSCMTRLEGYGDTAWVRVDKVQSIHMLRNCSRPQLLKALKDCNPTLWGILKSKGTLYDLKECIMRNVHDEQLTDEEWSARCNK